MTPSVAATGDTKPSKATENVHWPRFFDHAVGFVKKAEIDWRQGRTQVAVQRQLPSFLVCRVFDEVRPIRRSDFAPYPGEHFYTVNFIQCSHCLKRLL